MCDTAGTLTKAAELMLENGARSVRAMCTHGVLSGPAYDRIQNSQLTELIITDSIPLKPDMPTDKIRVIPVEAMFAQALTCLIENRSISSQMLIH
jgi:ribose-phosphate pyrophosphokinase